VAYQFKRGEPVPEGIRRIAREQLEAAVDSLNGESKRDAAIHDARKRVKKTRALLRLVKDELGDVYVAENTRLRDSGRGLSAFRDAAAIIGTFDDLCERYRDELGNHNLDSIRRGLLLHKTRAERKAGIKDALHKISASLAHSAKRTGRWTLATDGFAAIAPGLEDTFRRGAKALADVRKHPRSESFHEWRKRVKDHWYHVRLLEDLWSDVMSGYEKSLKQLEDWLGSDHNLTVLRERIAAEPEFYGTAQDIDLLMSLMSRQEKEWRDCALRMGERVYLEAPGRFRRRMAQLWETWQG
jgi:CHAD domain-containing protein